MSQLECYKSFLKINNLDGEFKVFKKDWDKGNANPPHCTISSKCLHRVCITESKFCAANSKFKPNYKS